MSPEPGAPGTISNSPDTAKEDRFPDEDSPVILTISHMLRHFGSKLLYLTKPKLRNWNIRPTCR